MRFQFRVDDIPAAPARNTINEAALDALESGYAYPDGEGRIVLHDCADIVDLKLHNLH